MAAPGSCTKGVEGNVSKQHSCWGHLPADMAEEGLGVLRDDVPGGLEVAPNGIGGVHNEGQREMDDGEIAPGRQDSIPSIREGKLPSLIQVRQSRKNHTHLDPVDRPDIGEHTQVVVFDGCKTVLVRL